MARAYELIWDSQELTRIDILSLKNLQGCSPNITEYEGMTLQLEKAALFKFMPEDKEDFESLCAIFLTEDGEKAECCTSSRTVINDLMEISDAQEEGEKFKFKIRSFKSKKNEGKYYRAMV